MKKIDIFMPPSSRYRVLQYFTRRMQEALARCGIQTRLLEAIKTDPASFIDQLLKDPPDCTFSFNGLLPDEEGHFLADMLGIPHVACLVDSPNYFLPLAQSHYTIVTCPDRSATAFFQGIGLSNALFMPHGVERELLTDPHRPREYDVVMLASCIDFEGIRARWKNKYSSALCHAMDEAADIALSDQSTPYYQAFVQALDHAVHNNGLDPKTVDFVNVLDDIERYIRGKDRVELVRAVKDAAVHVFGTGDGSIGWGKYLQQKNITLHDAVPFEQTLTIMKNSKILLNSCSWIKDGAHERIFAAIACGALVITNENIYMQEEFKDRESIIFYRHKQWDKVNDKVNAYLENPDKRIQVVEKGQEIVMKRHTWDARAEQLCKDLPAILANLKSADDQTKKQDP